MKVAEGGGNTAFCSRRIDPWLAPRRRHEFHWQFQKDDKPVKRCAGLSLIGTIHSSVESLMKKRSLNTADNEAPAKSS